MAAVAMNATWTTLPCLSVDCESTGIDPFTARPVELAAVEVMPDGETRGEWSWIVDPGVEIPQGAIDVHGITNERAKAEGIDARVAMLQIAEILWAHITEHRGRAGIVIFNAPYDLPLLIAEAERHSIELPPVGGLILDPLVLDRMADVYRRDEPVHFKPVADTHDGGFEQARQHRNGNRKLIRVAGLYDVELGDAAHGALADATASGRVLWAMTKRFPKLGRNSLSTLWTKQVHGAERERCRIQDYIRQQRDPLAEVIGGWPIRSQPEKDAAAKGPRKPRPRPVPAPAAEPVPMDETQNRRVHALLAKARPGQDRHAVLTEILGRTITTAKDLSTDDALVVVEALDAEVRTQTANAGATA